MRPDLLEVKLKHFLLLVKMLGNCLQSLCLALPKGIHLFVGLQSLHKDQIVTFRILSPRLGDPGQLENLVYDPGSDGAGCRLHIKDAQPGRLVISADNTKRVIHHAWC